MRGLNPSRSNTHGQAPSHPLMPALIGVSQASVQPNVLGESRASFNVGKRSREENNGNESDTNVSSQEEGKRVRTKLRKSGGWLTLVVSVEESKNEGKEKARDKSGDGDGEPGFLGRIGEGIGQYR